MQVRDWAMHDHQTFRPELSDFPLQDKISALKGISDAVASWLKSPELQEHVSVRCTIST
jgi:hypothetical protein